MTIGGFLKGGLHYPFHMPGHKRNPAFSGEYSASDITEIHGADNLQSPTGIIKGLQEKLSSLYGADESFILVNGSTVGIEAALLYCGQGRLLMARNSHRSAYGGVILSGGAADFLHPDIEHPGIPGRITAEMVEMDLREEHGAVFITSPTYEGLCSDIAAIAEIVHRRGKILVVDEAHGAHFGFSGFPENASRLGADIVIQSLHKTLPVPTQCAVIHVTGSRVDSRRLKNCIDILQTSSPSYFFMAEIEKCAEILLDRGADIFSAYCGRLSRFKDRLSETKHIRLLDTDDPGKLVFTLDSAMSGARFLALLREGYSIELEMGSLAHAVAMTSFADTDEGFSRLAVAVRELDSRCIGGVHRLELYKCAPKAAVNMREAFFGQKALVPISQAPNAISGDFIIPYPPGIPIVAPGEVISTGILHEINRLRQNGVEILGADEMIILHKGG